METDVLKNLLEQRKLEPYIRYIRFPQYKNVAPFTRIDFTFPITALVGANGTNKSSLLRALYGAPGNNNLGNYWFSTDTDPIVEGDDFPNCFIYGYRNAHTKQDVEVLKTRVKKENDPDYWEPSRPIRRYNMSAMPALDPKDPNRLRTRWKTISKNVELIDFRHAMSAFDRYFYDGAGPLEPSLAGKKALVRARSPHLKEAIDSGEPKHFWYKERIINGENGTLSPDELEAVRLILGRTYDEIRLICHRFFRLDGYTARISDSTFRYTEAFAGSGEFAAIMLVTKVMRAQPCSLILLDEPEVSLHPGAQDRLIDFLSRQVKLHKHQVIFTTHSPALIRRLPPEAIKVLAVESTSAKIILAAQSALPEEAFLQIGEPIAGTRTILVEDRLAAEIAKKALRIHAPNFLKLLDIRYFPGGASVLYQHYLPPYAAENRSDVLCLLDGDQKPDETWPDQKTVDKADRDQLEAFVNAQCKTDVKFPIDSGDDEQKAAQREVARRRFLHWCRSYVEFLPGGVCPEEFVLSKTGLLDGADPKARFVTLTRESLGLLYDEEDPSGDEIFIEQRRRLNTIAPNDEDLQTIATMISNFFAL